MSKTATIQVRVQLTAYDLCGLLIDSIPILDDVNGYVDYINKMTKEDVRTAVREEFAYRGYQESGCGWAQTMPDAHVTEICDLATKKVLSVWKELA